MKQVNHHRAGVSLVEVVIVVALSMFLMGLGIALINLLMRAESNQRESLQQLVNHEHLSRRFREDIHQATNAELTEDDTGQKLNLSSLDTQIVYLLNGNTMKRTETASKKTAREQFTFTRDTILKFSQENTEESSLICLRIQEQPQAPNSVYHLEAILNRHSRWSVAAKPADDDQ